MSDFEKHIHMNKYLVVYKVIHSHYDYELLENKYEEEILNERRN